MWSPDSNEVTERKVYHVAPVGEDGELAKGHVMSESCPCGPAVEERDDRTIWIHEMIQ